MKSLCIKLVALATALSCGTTYGGRVQVTVKTSGSDTTPTPLVSEPFNNNPQSYQPFENPHFDDSDGAIPFLDGAKSKAGRAATASARPFSLSVSSRTNNANTLQPSGNAQSQQAILQIINFNDNIGAIFQGQSTLRAIIHYVLSIHSAKGSDPNSLVRTRFTLFADARAPSADDAVSTSKTFDNSNFNNKAIDLSITLKASDIEQSTHPNLFGETRNAINISLNSTLNLLSEWQSSGDASFHIDFSRPISVFDREQNKFVVLAREFDAEVFELPYSTPEPSTWTLFVLAGGMTGLAMWKRSRAARAADAALAAG
jgi:hypothetical protein